MLSQDEFDGLHLEPVEVQLDDRRLVLRLIHGVLFDFVLKEIRLKNLHNGEVLRELELDCAVPAIGLEQPQHDCRRLRQFEVIIQATFDGLQEDVGCALDQERRLRLEQRYIGGVIEETNCITLLAVCGWRDATDGTDREAES